MYGLVCGREGEFFNGLYLYKGEKLQELGEPEELQGRIENYSNRKYCTENCQSSYHTKERQIKYDEQQRMGYFERGPKKGRGKLVCWTRIAWQDVADWSRVTTLWISSAAVDFKR